MLTEMGAWSASTRYRALQYEQHLRSLVGSLDVLMPADRPTRRVGPAGKALYFAAHAKEYVLHKRALTSVIPQYDALYIQRGFYPMGPGNIVAAAEGFSGRVVYDLDDAVFEEKPSMAGRGRVAHWLYGPQQAMRLLERADAVVVSTPLLRDLVRKHIGVEASILPTVPDPSRYSVALDQASPPVIGWAGTVGGLTYLDDLREVLEDIQAERMGRVEVVCSRPWAGESLFREWRLQEETRALAQFSLGIMPLPDQPYTRAKAGFKLLQYMAAGLPVVASPVGINIELVERSGAGLLAKTPHEWDCALRRLLGDRALRRTMGSSGRRFVQAYANLPRHAHKLAELLVGPC